jgi:hypothetical protein
MSPINDNILVYISSSISWTLIYFDYLISTKTYHECIDIIDENKKDFADNSTCQYNETIPGELKTRISQIEYFKYYLEPNPDIKDNLITKMNWNLSKSEGINPEEGLMKRFRKSIMIFDIFFVLAYFIL